MLKVFVIHNNEADRLDRMLPDLALLTEALGHGLLAEPRLVGPKEVPRPSSTRWGSAMARRSRAAVIALTELRMAQGSPDRPNAKQAWNRLRAVYRAALSDTLHSPIAERDLVRKHLYAWRAIARGAEMAIVCECDALIHGQSETVFRDILKFLHADANKDASIYVDLAGGLDRSCIANAWCFEPKHGCRDTRGGSQFTVLSSLPRLTTNTTCAYLISPAMAKRLLKFASRTVFRFPIDWMINAFSISRLMPKAHLCLHTTPTALIHGSMQKP